MSAPVAFELGEAVSVPMKDVPATRLVFIAELLKEVAALKRRVIALEKQNGVAESSVEDRPAVEAGRGHGHRVGRSGDADNDCVHECVEENHFARPERHVQSQLADAYVASAHEAF
jgi:hypothetical protein